MNTSPCRQMLSRVGASAGRCGAVAGGAPSRWLSGSRRGDAGCGGARRRSPAGLRDRPAGFRTRRGASTGGVGIVLHAGFGVSGWVGPFRYPDAVELFDGFTAQDDFRIRLPDFGRGDAAREAMQFAGVVEDVFEGLSAFGVAHPRAGNQYGGAAYKPGVEEVLARTRIPGNRAVY